MSHRTRLIVSIILVVACVAALVTSVPVSLPYAYSYTVSFTETPTATSIVASLNLTAYYAACSYFAYWGYYVTCTYPIPPGEGLFDQMFSELVKIEMLTTTWTGMPFTYSKVKVATTTSTGDAPLFHVALNSSLQPYACTHLNLAGAVLSCVMQFWEAMVVLLIALIVVVSLLVYSFMKRRKTQASKLDI